MAHWLTQKARYPMKIEVTQEDIDSGVRADCRRCPIALSVKRATGCKYVGVTNFNLFADYGWREIHIPLPSDALDFVHNFDEGRPVKPAQFEMELTSMTPYTIPTVAVQAVTAPEAVKTANVHKAIAAHVAADVWPNEAALPAGVDILRMLPNKAVHILSKTAHRGRRNRYSLTHARCETLMGIRECVVDCGCRAWHRTQACRHAVLSDTILNADALKPYLAGRGEVIAAYEAGSPCTACTGSLLRVTLYVPAPVVTGGGYGYLNGTLCAGCGDWRIV